MVYGIIDVREWQTVVNLETGEKSKIDDETAVIAKNVISKNYYPGDFDLKSIEWVKDMALNLDDQHRPDFMFMSFAQPYFISRFKKISVSEWHETIDYLFDSIDEFLKKTDFVPVIIGLGSMTPLIDYIDLSNLDGIALCGGMSAYYSGLFDASPDDIKYLNTIPEVERVVSKRQFIEQFGGSQDFIRRFPDYLLEAKKGYTFKGYGAMTRPIYKIPAKDEFIPLYTPLQSTDLNSIIDIKNIIQKNLLKNKIALIILEGIGIEEFILPHIKCSNKSNWYTYEQTDTHYLAITTGKHFQYNDYPPGYKYFVEDGEYKKYPYSGPYVDIPEDTIGRELKTKSAAAGSRSVLTHLASGADISIECFARSLYNYGTMAIINKKNIDCCPMT
jgi:hypothetical protein